MSSPQPQRIFGPSPVQRRVFYRDGDTVDIMRVVMYADKRSREFVLPAATRTLAGGNEYATCRNIFNFIRQNVRYQADKPGDEIVRSPGYLIQSGRGDCKSYSIAILALCRANGIDARYRFVSYAPGPYKHVYVVATLSNGEEVILDAVYGKFDKELPYKRKRDVRSGKNIGIAGIGGFLDDSALLILVALIAWLWIAQPFEVKIKQRKKKKNKNKKAKT